MVVGLGATCTHVGAPRTRYPIDRGRRGPADDKATITSAATTAEFAAGIYKWNGTSWVSQGDGVTFPPSPAEGNYYRLAEHDISADATSGAGGDKSTVSIAGALALNIVSDHTEAIVPSGAHVTATGGGGALSV